jgi:hypothetical protein
MEIDWPQTCEGLSLSMDGWEICLCAIVIPLDQKMVAGSYDIQEYLSIHPVKMLKSIYKII